MQRSVRNFAGFGATLAVALLTSGVIDEPWREAAASTGHGSGVPARHGTQDGTTTAPPRTPSDAASASSHPIPSPAPENAGAGECPANMILVEGEHCYLWEQVCQRWADPAGHPEGRVCAEFQAPSLCVTRRHPMRFCIDRDEYVDADSNVPASGVSWEQARARCVGHGKRLCTSLEWEFACEGEQGLPYPYGHRRSPSLCNQDRVERDSPSRAKHDLREAPHPSCVSPFGVRDMVGNVDEWVERRFARAPRRAELRGGWWMTGRNRCRAATTSHDERYAGQQTGFRCCKNAPAR